MINEGLFTSTTDMWETPQQLFDKLNKEFQFDIDVCATEDNTKCETYFSPEMDGLSQDWTGVCWMNPPYGRKITNWIRKAYESSLMGATVVCLIPARTDTKYFHDYCIKGEIRFIKGRLKFGDSTNSAPFPSCIVIFSNQAEQGILKVM